MHNQSYTSRILLVAFPLLLAACGKSSPTSPAAQTSVVTPAVIAGNWVVSALTQRTENKTSQFSGYVFAFTRTGAESGTVTATKNGSSVSGTWSHQAAVTYYGSTSQEAMVLNLGASSPFDRVSKTWNVVSSTSTRLTLVNPEVLEDEHLVFAKQ